jgi:UTP--glucose-1-phosphate uridylyltransferase
MKVRKAVIPVAGLGTRFLPASKAIPKEMLTIVDRPTIQYIVEEVVASGIEQVILVTSEGKSAIENHFDYNFELDTILQEKNKDNLREELNHISNLIDVVSVRQKKPLGLGHAIWTTRNVVGNEPFVVLLGDDLVLSEEPCCKQMLRLFDDVQESIVAIQRVPLDQTFQYGIVEGAPYYQANPVRIWRLSAAISYCPRSLPCLNKPNPGMAVRFSSPMHCWHFHKKGACMPMNLRASGLMLGTS